MDRLCKRRSVVKNGKGKKVSILESTGAGKLDVREYFFNENGVHDYVTIAEDIDLSSRNALIRSLAGTNIDVLYIQKHYISFFDYFNILTYDEKSVISQKTSVI